MRTFAEVLSSSRWSKVREDVAAVSVLADVEAVGIGLTGIIIYV